MGIIYTVTVLLMLILHMLLYKKQQKQNIVKWLAISTVMLFCYNILVCVILTFIKIPSTLVTLSIINVITNIGLGIKIYKDKKIQKYSIDIIDISLVIALLAIVIATIIIQFGFPFDIEHIITDGVVHYTAAKDFSEYSYLLIEENSDGLRLYNLPFLQPGAYINTGIVFKVFSSIVNDTYMYHLYFLFDGCMWLLSGLIMYGLLIKSNKKTKKILPAIFAIIYMLGYPLNSYISGFSYLNLGLNIVVAILIIMQEKLNKHYKYILMLFLNIGLLFSYYFFAPVVYLAIFIQIILNIKKSKKKIINLDNILNVSFTLVIPAIFWFLYFVVLQALKFKEGPTYGTIVNIDGDIYSNFIMNNLIFLLLAIFYIGYSMFYNRKNIKNTMLIIHIIFMQILFFGVGLDLVSEYYFYKTHYLLWLLVISVGLDGIRLLMKNGNKVKYITLIGIIIYVMGITSVITSENIYEKPLAIYDIFRENTRYVRTKELMLMPHEEIEILDYYNKNINADRLDDETLICSSKYVHGKPGWIYAITRNAYNYLGLTYYDEIPDVEMFIESEKKYFLIFQRDYGPRYKEIYDIIKDNNIQIKFETEAGMILEKI